MKAARGPIKMNDGCTAVAAYIEAPPIHPGTFQCTPAGEIPPHVACAEATIHVANAGDSRAIIVQRNGRAQPLTEDHKPHRPDEMKRIKNAGGTVQFFGVWRVQGVLAVSRSIGDRLLKPYVTAAPEVTRYTVSSKDAYLLIASDGLWDVLSNSEAASLLMAAQKQGIKPQAAAQLLVQEALLRGSADNITVMVIDLSSRAYPIPGVHMVSNDSSSSVIDGTEGMEEEEVSMSSLDGDSEQINHSQSVPLVNSISHHMEST